MWRNRKSGRVVPLHSEGAIIKSVQLVSFYAAFDYYSDIEDNDHIYLLIVEVWKQALSTASQSKPS